MDRILVSMSKNKCDQESIFGVCTLLLVLSLFGVHLVMLRTMLEVLASLKGGFWLIGTCQILNAVLLCLMFGGGEGGGAALFYPF